MRCPKYISNFTNRWLSFLHKTSFIFQIHKYDDWKSQTFRWSTSAFTYIINVNWKSLFFNTKKFCLNSYYDNNAHINNKFWNFFICGGKILQVDQIIFLRHMSQESLKIGTHWKFQTYRIMSGGTSSIADGKKCLFLSVWSSFIIFYYITSGGECAYSKIGCILFFLIFKVVRVENSWSGSKDLNYVSLYIRQVTLHSIS